MQARIVCKREKAASRFLREELCGAHCVAEGRRQ